ncbi:hypothetical protein [Streptomyces sp. RerS4]|uniref:hypothetical protein n=1 Tax=Streptomyces sp. RerS4 TaxID=2942449 RepID=UPI00201C7308|nr:hypothetical protein [Streptomyces sp. RerS4]UQX02963.1 hypothetical protein M4D82_22570 [Streptomyces sp. RerS4]
MRTVRTAGAVRAPRAAGAVAATALAVALLGGCGRRRPEPAGSSSRPSGSPGAPARATPTTPTTPTPTTPTPPAGSPGPTGSPAPSASPESRTEHLVTVIRTGGFAGRSRGLLVRADGSWTLVDGKAEVLKTGRLTGAALADLRRALGEADFARLPREAKADPPVYDGFAYAFTYGGHTVRGDQGALAPALEKVLDRLPAFDAAP